MNQRDTPEEIEWESLVQPEFAVAEHGHAVLAEIVQVVAPLHRDTGRPPRLLHAERNIQCLIEPRLGDAVENGGVPVTICLRPDLVAECEQSSRGFRVRISVVLDGGGY